jgi:hypothetical protein
VSAAESFNGFGPNQEPCKAFTRDEVRAILRALPGYCRQETDHSSNLFTVSNYTKQEPQGERVYRKVWIDNAGAVHEVVKDHGGRVTLADGRHF